MTQYCRYCTNMICGDANYCSCKKRIFTDSQIKRPNKCKDFDFNEIDALGENPKPYKPRGKREENKILSGQVAFMKGGAE